MFLFILQQNNKPSIRNLPHGVHIIIRLYADDILIYTLHTAYDRLAIMALLDSAPPH